MGSGPVWTGGKSRPHRIFFGNIYCTSIADRPDRSSVTITTELPGPRMPEWLSNNYEQLFNFLFVPLRAPTTAQGVRFDVLTAELLKNQVVWGVTPCQLIHSYRRFVRF